jgi:hypothetical protein
VLIEADEGLSDQVFGIGLILTIPVGETMQRTLPTDDQSIQRGSFAHLQRQKVRLIVG